jgi:hypothetical protein
MSSFSTATVQDSYTPTWTPTTVLTGTSADLLAGFQFQLWDSDLLSNDQITGVLVITFVESNFAAGTVTVGPVDGAESITFSVAKSVP